MKDIDMKEYTKKRRRKEGGFSVMDLLIWGGVVAVVLGILGVASVYFTKWKEKQAIVSEFKMIVTGLDNYYQNRYSYPTGTGWGWNTNNAFVPQEVINRGWQYSCSDNTITITTPPIGDSRVLGQLQGEFETKCDNYGINGNQIICELVNKPCPAAGT